jgi:hypothetical protein
MNTFNTPPSTVMRSPWLDVLVMQSCFRAFINTRCFADVTLLTQEQALRVARALQTPAA